MSDIFAAADALYHSGHYEVAFEMFQKLADAGDVPAMERLAVMYGAGQGVAKDTWTSIAWDEKAAECGSVVACASLGRSYLRVGDPLTAKRWFETAVSRGHEDALLDLAKLLLALDPEWHRVTEYLKMVRRSETVCMKTWEDAGFLLGVVDQMAAASAASVG